MVTAVFEPGAESAKTEELWQYDYGQVLRIEGLELPSAVEIHFSTQKKEGEAERRVGVTKDGVTEVPIPDTVLKNEGSTSSYSIYAFIYLTDETSGKTIRWTQTKVKPRPKPIPERPEEEREEIFREAIQAVNDAADRAEISLAEAKVFKEASATNAAKTAEDREVIEEKEKNIAAMEISVVENTELAEQYKSQAQAATTNALQSEQAAKEAQTASEAARAGAETAEYQAELCAQKTEEDKNKVEQTRAIVVQLEQEVTDNKNSIENVVQDFILLTEQKTADINNAGEEVIGEIETAKMQTIQIVQQEGVTQVQNMKEIAADIEADREQIQQNQVDITMLQEEIKNAAASIVNTASGRTILLTDSTDKKLHGMKVYGRTTQETTTGAQLLDIDAMLNDNLIRNNDGSYSIQRTETNRFSKYLATDFEPGTYCFAAEIIDYNGIYPQPLQLHILFEDGLDTTWSIKTSTRTFDKKIISIGIYQDANNDVGTYTKFKNLMVNVGSIVLPYEPYTGGQPSPSPDYPQKLVNAGDKGNIETVVTGKNLFNMSKVTGNRIDNDGQALTITTIENDSSSGANQTLREISTGLRIGRTYTLSAKTSGTVKHIYLYKTKERWHFGESRIISETDLDSRVYFYASGENTSATISEIQIELGTEATAYEPYRALQSLLQVTPNGLPGIPVSSSGNYTDENGKQWVCDEIDFERGVYVQRIGEIEFDGKTNGKKLHGADSGVFDKYNYAYIMLRNINGLENAKGCLANKAVYWDGTIARVNRSAIYLSTAMSVFLSNNLTKITNEDTREERINKINAVLIQWYEEGQPLVVKYVLAEPIETPLSADELAIYRALHTNYPTTTIYNDEDCWLEVEYTADTKTHIEQNYVPKESYMALEKRVAALETQTVENI